MRRDWLSWAVRRGFQRGLVEGDQFWLVLGAMALMLQLGIRVYRKKPLMVFSGPDPHRRTAHRGPLRARAQQWSAWA